MHPRRTRLSQALLEAGKKVFVGPIYHWANLKGICAFSQYFCVLAVKQTVSLRCFVGWWTPLTELAHIHRKLTVCFT
jgi:hypothetical protein